MTADPQMFRLLALRGALTLELKGMSRRGRSARSIACDLLKLNRTTRTAKVLDALNKHIAEVTGVSAQTPT